MLAVLDVHYFSTHAQAAAMILDDWPALVAAAHYRATVTACGEYEPGQFYLRELRPLEAVLALIQEPLDAIVIDAYCHLAADGTPGLGAHLYESLEGRIAIVGVAKNRYRQSTHAVELLRGESRRPLFVTSVGLPQQIAAEHIASMSGPFRLPTMLKAVDQLARAPLAE